MAESDREDASEVSDRFGGLAFVDEDIGDSKSRSGTER